MARDTVGKGWLVIAGAVLLFVIACVAGTYVSVFSANLISDQEKWGQFGDYFGGVLNPILSFFALITLLITLHIQLSANKDGDRRHHEQLREQRFFQLVGLMNENALTTKVSTSFNDPAVGREAQHDSLVKLKGKLGSRANIRAVTEEDMFEGLQDEYHEWKSYSWPAIGIFVDSFFLVLDFVLAEEMEESSDSFALNVLRLQLSESERLLVWYSAMFTPRCARYLMPLLDANFVSDLDMANDDVLKPWRDELIRRSLVWASYSINTRP